MRRTRDALVAAALSLLVPGAGHLYAGERRRAYVLLGASATVAVAALALAAAADELALGALDSSLLGPVLLANAAVLALRLFAIVDSWRAAAGPRTAAAALAAVAALAALPHLAAGYVAARGYLVLDEVFADEEPRDVLRADGVFVADAAARGTSRSAGPPTLDPPAQRPFRPLPGRRDAPFRGEARPLADATQVVADEPAAVGPPWVTILLLGSDRGPGQPGDRTDTMIVAALQRETGRAVLFGIPRNLVGVPLGGVAGERLRRFPQSLNALYAFARLRPELFPGGEDPGATALKQTISRLLGLRIDYHALVDLDGFVDLVDALGGVRIRVQERIVDEVTRPAWGETKPRIDVYPGRTYRFTGRTALAYVRSRKTSNDYRRMARQRCFLSAMAQQLDVVSVLRRFGSLARAVEASVRTDVPLDRAPDLARLAADVEPTLTLTETFGPPYFAGRRASDRFPYPNVAKIRASVREAILDPSAARSRGKVASAASC